MEEQNDFAPTRRKPNDHQCSHCTSRVTSNTPWDSDDAATPKVANPKVNLDAPADSGTKTQKSATKKRSRLSPKKKTAKKLFTDENTGNGDMMPVLMLMLSLVRAKMVSERRG